MFAQDVENQSARLIHSNWSSAFFWGGSDTLSKLMSVKGL
jgi:hypothetical protein